MELYTESSKRVLLINIRNTGSSSRIEVSRLLMNYKHGEAWYVKDKHSNINELSKILDLNDYYTVSFVRNPYEVFISKFRRIYERVSDFKVVLNNFIQNNNSWKQEAINDNYKTKWSSQSSMIVIDNVLKIDRLCYYENYDEEWKRLCEDCNLPYDKLKIDTDIIKASNSNSHTTFSVQKRGGYNDFLTEGSKRIIYNFYKKDFINFKYDKDFD